MSYAPKPGGYRWRALVAELIDSENSEIATLGLMAKHAQGEAAQIIAGITLNGARRLGAFHELLEFKEGKGDV